MSHAYARARIDRDVTTEGGPIRFVAATEGRKDDNVDLRMSGALLDRFRANPVVLYGHQSFGRDTLPIGRAVETAATESRLLIDVEFDQADDFAARVERKYRDGFLSAVSIGFSVTKWEGGQGSVWAGGVAEEWELLELSAVPVPMDADAVVESGRVLARLLGEPQAGEAIRRIVAAELERIGINNDQPPEVAGITRDAARDLFAALTLVRGSK